MLALPAEPGALAASGFSITAAVSTNTFTSPPRLRDQPARQHLQPLLDDLVIVLALRIDRDRAALALLEDRERIVIRPVVHPEHDDRAHVAATARADRRAAARWSPSSSCRRARLRRGIARAAPWPAGRRRAARCRRRRSRWRARLRSSAALTLAGSFRSRGRRRSATAACPASVSASIGRNDGRDFTRAYQFLAASSSLHGTSPR